MSAPKVLLFDLETTPILAWVWGLWKQTVGLPAIVRDSHLLTWSAKWLGDDYVMYDSLIAHKLYAKEPYNDLHVTESMWHLLDEADVVVAQNGDKFDVPKINTRFLYHELPPPSPYKTVDTLKIAKASMRLTSNKLDWMAKFLFDESKIKTDFDLWTGCIRGDKRAWAQMIEYNQKDVTLLENVYLALRPWAKTHPNMGLYIDLQGSMPLCPRCGSSDLSRNGTKTSKTMLGRYQQYHCGECGCYPRGRVNLNDKDKQKSLLTNTL